MSERELQSFEHSRYNTALKLLNEISEIILEHRNYRHVLDEIIKKVSRAFYARAGSIAVPDEQDEHLEFVAGFNKDPDLLDDLKTSTRRVNEGVAGRAYAKEQVYSVSNVFDESTAFKERYHEHAERQQFRAIFSIPLIAFDSCIGVVTLYFEGERSFGDLFRKIITPVANQIAIAMLQSDLIEDLEQARTRFKKRAERDSLTDLPNHSKIQTVLREELDRAARYDHTTSCIMVDIDHFKSINDTYGHPFGDMVLEQLTDYFREETRSEDTVGRYGGEEFLFVLPEIDGDSAFQLAERMRTGVEEMVFEHDDVSTSVTISLGVSSLMGDAFEAEEVIKRADTALLGAKDRGRNRTLSYEDVEQQERETVRDERQSEAR